MASTHILVVDDEPEIRNLVRDILEDEGYQVTTAGGAMQARAACMSRKPDLVLLDIWMPGTDGITLLKEWRDKGDLPFRVIMMSGHGTIETAVEATRLGAFDFLEKPLSMAKLLVTVERAIEVHRLEQENLGLKDKQINLLAPIGQSEEMASLRHQAEAISRHESPVMLQGEAGTGKETLARYIHSLSNRADAPFVTLRMAAIASDNLDAAIFGREQAGQVYYGHLEQAHGGTLFIDELTDLDQSTQTRLLSVLQASALLRVDGAQPVSIDLRVIASTRSDPQLALREGRLRDDLYFYLNVLPIEVPPLRQHSEDIDEIVDYYSRVFARTDNLPVPGFSEQALNRLRQYDWPGNVRELKNLVQRMMILGRGGEVQLEDVNQALGNASRATEVADGIVYDDSIMSLPLREARESFERDYILHQWQQVGGSVTKLASKIGMERTHLYRKLKSLGIEHKKSAKRE